MYRLQPCARWWFHAETPPHYLRDRFSLYRSVRRSHTDVYSQRHPTTPIGQFWCGPQWPKRPRRSTVRQWRLPRSYHISSELRSRVGPDRASARDKAAGGRCKSAARTSMPHGMCTRARHRRAWDACLAPVGAIAGGHGQSWLPFTSYPTDCRPSMLGSAMWTVPATPCAMAAS